MPDDYEQRRQDSRDYEHRREDQQFFEESLAERSDDFYKALEGDDRVGIYNALGISPPSNAASDSPTLGLLDELARQVGSRRQDVHEDVGFLPASLLKDDLESSLANLTSANCTSELQRLHDKVNVARAIAGSDTRSSRSASLETNLSRVKESLMRLQEQWSRYLENR